MDVKIDGKEINIDSYGTDEFFTATHICTRARFYPVGAIGHQSGHDGKMATMFVATDASTASAQQAIKVNIARTFWNADGDDIDKMSIAEAMAVYNKIIPVIEMAATSTVAFIIANKHIATRKQMEKFIKVAIDGFNVIHRGAKSTMIIAFDGSCSGIQFASGITRNEEMAASVNIAGSVIRNDIYIKVVDIAIKQVNDNKGDYRADTIKIINDPKQFNRDIVKPGVMTQAYGSGFYKIMQDAFKHIDAHTDAIVEVADIIFKARNEVTKAAVKMMVIFDIINKAVDGIATFTHRDGFVYSNAKPTYKRGYIVAGKNDHKKGQSAISPDIIHSFDAAHVRAVRNAATFDIVTIHDSFGCAPQHAEELNIIIRQEFINLFSGNRNVIEEFYNENKAKMSDADAERIGKLVAAFEFGELDIASVMNNEFAWS